MLEILFCNVGDGDAILLTERAPGNKDYHVLIDAGRPYLEPAEGSRRREAIYDLKALGIETIDLMILTHLHIDHIGGAMRILDNIRVKKMCSLFIPDTDAEWIALPDTTEKPLLGLCYALNIFSDIARKARAQGCILEEMRSGTVSLTDRLSMTTYLPREEVCRSYLAVSRMLYQNQLPEHDLWYRASKNRNLTSLMNRFTYAGRSILLTGDRYGFDWEEESIGPCDILKLPHHGDPKSMTPRLIRKLRPEYAVISCQNGTNAKKDRPNAEVLSFVRDTVPHVLCTENREMPDMAAHTGDGIRFRISENGFITCLT